MTDTRINDTTSYPNVAPADGDHVIGTDVSSTAKHADGDTKTFTFSDMATYFRRAASGWEFVETVWDYAADGAVTAITTSAFEDGYEYRIVGMEFGLTSAGSTGTYIYMQIQKESDSSWIPASVGADTKIITSTGTVRYFGAIIDILNPRQSSDLHVLHMSGWCTGTTSPAGKDTATDTQANKSGVVYQGFASATKVKALRILSSFSTFGAGGPVVLFRRPIAWS